MRLKKKLAAIAGSTLFTMIGALFYPMIFGDFTDHHQILCCAGAGFFIGLIVAAIDLTLFDSVSKKLAFSILFVARTVLYVVVVHVSVIFVLTQHLALLHSYSHREAFLNGEVQQFFFGSRSLHTLAYGFCVLSVINFIRQINRLLGQNILFNYITGKYHRPAEEERVFMFVDLKGSTTIAEKLGHKQFHRFLNDFFIDISPAIVESRGEIYQYVGDEVVITWTKRKGLPNAACLKCYFQMNAIIQLRSEKYHEKYGCIPTFKAGYHYGEVIIGEVGDIKKDIVFHGDTVNTASRIRSECSVFGKDLLLSADLLRQMPMIEYLTPESMGKMRLRGKNQEIELFSIREAA